MGNQESAHEELTRKLIFSKSQDRSNSLKNTDDIREGDSLTNLGTFARGQGSGGTVSGNENTDRCHFFFFPFLPLGDLLPAGVISVTLFFNLTKTVNLAQMFQRTSPDQSTCPHWPL